MTPEALLITTILLTLVWLLLKFLKFLRGISSNTCSICGGEITWRGHTYFCLNSECPNYTNSEVKK